MTGPGRAEVVEALHRVAFLLERQRASEYRSRAYRTAGERLRDLDEPAWDRHRAAGSWQQVEGIGSSTAAVVAQVLEGTVPEVLGALERELADRLALASPGGVALRREVRGDLHAHTEASDGAATMTDMVLTAVGMGHDYLAVTDHSPRLTVANGLSPARLAAQVEQIDAMNTVLGPFRILRGIEVDILDDGTLDQRPELLDRLDVVVASVHSKLRQDAAAMTARLLTAVAQPWTDVLGHCTGRKVQGRERPPSRFDAPAVFAACVEQGVAVEVNASPDRRDPPDELLALAAATGCLFSVDSDAHAPGQLDWLVDGCDRLAAVGVGAERVVTTWPVERLLEWTGRPR